MVNQQVSASDQGYLGKWQAIPAVKRRIAVAGVLFSLALAMLLVSLGGPGVGWDEPYYLTAGHDFHLPWFGSIGSGAFSRESIERHWSAVHWHPPLGQILIGLTQYWFAPWLGRLMAGRLATAAVFAALAAGLYLFMAWRYGEATGLLSVVCLVGMPRVFGQAHFADLDLPVTAAWFAVVAAFALGIDNRRWRAVAGLALGIALLTKATAVPLPLLLVAWAAFSHGKRAFRPCLWLLLALPVFLLWPWMWIEPWEHLKGYLGTVQDRPPISVYYFGTAMDRFQVPFHYPLVMTGSTTPVLILLGAFVGACGVLKRWRNDPTGVLLVANAVYVLAIASAPGIAKYDSVRLFLPVFPFLAALGGIGLTRSWDWARERPGLRRNLGPALAGLFAVYHLGWLYVVHPFYLSDYGGAVGALPGANRLGFETTYWCEAVDQPVRDFVNAHASRNAKVAIHPFPLLASLFYLDCAFFREDLQLVDETRERSWDMLVLVCRKGMFDEEMWRCHRERRPVFERRLLGVPLCQVFERELAERR
jgi:hypothetical protein